jgi:hypothetical protein
MTRAARSARSTSVPQVQAGTRSARRRAGVVLAAFTVALALAGCGSGGGSSSGTSASTSTSSAAAALASAASVKACLEGLGYTDEGTLPKAYLAASDPNKARNLYAVSPLEYHNEGTGFEAHGLPGQGDIYVNIATSPEEASVHLHESRLRYTEPIPEEIVEKRKGDFHETHYKIGSVGNVAYLAWSNPTEGVSSINKCAKP